MNLNSFQFDIDLYTYLIYSITHFTNLLTLERNHLAINNFDFIAIRQEYNKIGEFSFQWWTDHILKLFSRESKI